MRHVIFQIEKERYGLSLDAVREVFSPPTVFSRVPAAPPPIRGVINLRGRVVTVITLSPGRTTPAIRGVARLQRFAITILDIEGINGAVTALFPKRLTG